MKKNINKNFYNLPSASSQVNSEPNDEIDDDIDEMECKITGHCLLCHFNTYYVSGSRYNFGSANRFKGDTIYCYAHLFQRSYFNKGR